MTDSNPFEITKRLSERGVTYAIIGGHAVNFYGYMRATEDINIVFLRTRGSRGHAYNSWDRS